MKSKKAILAQVTALFVCLLLEGCVTTQSGSWITPNSNNTTNITNYNTINGDKIIERDVTAYQKAGRDWGELLAKEPGKIVASTDLSKDVSLHYVRTLFVADELTYYGLVGDGARTDEWYATMKELGFYDGADEINPKSLGLVAALVRKDNYGLNIFGVNTELQEAFKKGFREGYKERTADLVLGPHLEKAGGVIGEISALGFVSVINTFENGWAYMLRDSVDVFIRMIAEGSQADREKFIKTFIAAYKLKFENNKGVFAAGTDSQVVTEGGSIVYLDPNKTRSTMRIPSDNDLKVAIYTQAFIAMGSEMGRRYSHNLIPRGELIEWLRRSKTALNMDRGDIDQFEVKKNLRVLATSFCNAYVTDAQSVFEDLAREAGYKSPFDGVAEKPLANSVLEKPVAQQSNALAETQVAVQKNGVSSSRR